VVPAAGAVVTNWFARARAKADTDAVVENATAESYVRVWDIVEPVLNTGAEITGDVVRIHARHENITLESEADASILGIVPPIGLLVLGTAEAIAGVNYDSFSRVTGQDAATITNSDLLVSTFQAVSVSRDADAKTDSPIPLIPIGFPPVLTLVGSFGNKESK